MVRKAILKMLNETKSEVLKNKNFQPLLFFKISTWPQKTNCRTLVRILFS